MRRTLALLLLSGCSLGVMSPARLANVKVGWTEEQVTSYLGPPDLVVGEQSNILEYWSVRDGTLGHFTIENKIVQSVEIVPDPNLAPHATLKKIEDDTKTRELSLAVAGALDEVTARNAANNQRSSYVAPSTPKGYDLQRLTGYSASTAIERFGQPYSAAIVGPVVCGSLDRCHFDSATFVYYTAEGGTAYVYFAGDFVTSVSFVAYRVAVTPGIQQTVSRR